jgi:hypothetical protein
MPKSKESHKLTRKHIKKDVHSFENKVLRNEDELSMTINLNHQEWQVDQDQNEDLIGDEKVLEEVVD